MGIKGALRNFGEELQTQNFNIYNIYEEITRIQKYVFNMYLTIN